MMTLAAWWMAVLLCALVILAFRRPAVPGRYWQRQQTGGEIESRYAEMGAHAVESREYPAREREFLPKRDRCVQRHFKVWYPAQAGRYPLVVMVNGTGVPYQKYERLFEHLASWGFVVIGNDYQRSWDGRAASLALDFALETPDICKRVDAAKIAVGGHSQGGQGACNAVAQHANGRLYRCAFLISATSRPLALSLGWGYELGTEAQFAYDLSAMRIPVLMLAGTGRFDAGTVMPLTELEANYRALPRGVQAVMARRSDTDHGEMLWRSDPYVTAWLMHHLYADERAGRAFFGSSPEMGRNPHWQDFAGK